MGTLLTSSKKQKSNSKLFKEENEFSVSVDFQEENIQREVRSRGSHKVRKIFFFSLFPSISWVFSLVWVGFILEPEALLFNPQQLQGYVILRVRKASGKRDYFS